MRDYYFITYAAHSARGMKYWNDVIDISPMEFIDKMIKTEEIAEGSFYDYVVTSVHPITSTEFEKWNDRF